MSHKIFTIQNRGEEKFLRKRVEDFEFSKFSQKEIQELILRMKKAMRAAKGVGLSANQIGLPLKVFVAEIPEKDGGSKFYAIFNPRIEKASKESTSMQEGCLSVPGIYGEVERPSRVVLKGFDKHGRSLKIKAWGLLAKVFQHEIDHLNGILFIDKAKELYTIEPTE